MKVIEEETIYGSFGLQSKTSGELHTHHYF